MMNMNERDIKPILKIELIGIIFIVLFGSSLHFTFEISGRNFMVGIFSAVNESVWEHLKLTYWPAVIYAVIEYRYLKKITENFFTAKALSIYLMPAIIVSSFYTYTLFIEENLLIDILIFIMAVVIGQLTSYKTMTWKKTLRTYTKFSVIAIIFLASLFIVFTFNPPRLSLFQDPITKEYGIF